MDSATDMLTEALLKIIQQNHEPEENVFSKICMIMYDVLNVVGRFRHVNSVFIKDVGDMGISDVYKDLSSA